MDANWIVFAFIFGFFARRLNLPPLVGYLLAGFTLNEMNVMGGDFLKTLSDLGVQLLLFSIGLKLRLRSLSRTEVWGGATLHMILMVLMFGGLFFGASQLSLPFFKNLDLKSSLLVAFALSFSSTVFAVKIFEERGEINGIHARTSIGILIIQDIFAVLFLTFSTGKWPSPWFLGVLLLMVVLKPILSRILNHTGHGELQLLYGFLVCFGGATLFEVTNMKPDLGALVFGLLLSTHPKAGELSKSLLSIKDLFLVGFFLSIGLESELDWSLLPLIGILILLLSVKGSLYFFLLTRFGLRPRTSFLSSLSLFNYSEFGLIVGSIAVSTNLIQSEWIFVIAMALSLSFIFASFINGKNHSIYLRCKSWLQKFQTKRTHPEDHIFGCEKTEVLVFGMGRVGTKVYDALYPIHKNKLTGVDVEHALVTGHAKEGRNVVFGDATDPNFWDRMTSFETIKLIILALPNEQANKSALKQIKQMGFPGHVSSLVHHKDHENELIDLGASSVFNVYEEIGTAYGNYIRGLPLE